MSCDWCTQYKDKTYKSSFLSGRTVVCFLYKQLYEALQQGDSSEIKNIVFTFSFFSNTPVAVNIQKDENNLCQHKGVQ